MKNSFFLKSEHHIWILKKEKKFYQFVNNIQTFYSEDFQDIQEKNNPRKILLRFEKYLYLSEDGKHNQETKFQETRRIKQWISKKSLNCSVTNNKKVIFSHQLEIPINCRALTTSKQITNYQHSATMYQPILLPWMNRNVKTLTKINTQLDLEHYQLDEPQQIKARIISNDQFSNWEDSRTPQAYGYNNLWSTLFHILHKKSKPT